ncbi:hypothetical protein BGW39_002967, partial [Mortierella sp. 14UC]
PRLTTLTLDPIEINTDLDLNVFSRTLSTINNLQSLSLSIYTDHLNAEDVLKALVYNSPSSLESFSLFLEAKEIPVSLVAAVVDHERASLGLKDLDDGNADLSGAEDLDDEDAYLSDTMSALLGPIVERKEPLRRLTDWKLINRYGNIDGDIFISLLEFLPELTSMDVPSIGFQAPVHTFDAATRISKACPKLRNLSKRHIHTDKEGTMALALLHKMPINTVESLQVAWLSEDVRTFGDGLGFHRESVKSIVFDVCRWIAAESLASIFFQSSALEVFRISMNHASVFKIPLEGMVRQQWASNKFTDVKLYLRLPDNHKEAKQPAEPDTTIPNWAVDLERFYRQIGALALLRILDLRVAVPRYSLDRSGALITYKAKTFAGMLTLEDRAAGRLGWLQLLGGLKNLEELHGSFNIGSMVAGFEFSQHEADWIVDHWPRLGFIELYTHHKDAEVEGADSVPLYYSAMVEFLHDLNPPLATCNSTRTSTLDSTSSLELTSATQLVSHLTRDTLDALCNASSFSAQFLFVIRFSPRLAILDLGNAVINTDVSLNLLSRVL